MVPMTSLFPNYKYANLQAFTYINGNNLSDAEMKHLRSIWNKVITGSVLTEYMTQRELVNPKDYSKSIKADVDLMTEAGLSWKAN